MSVNSQLPTPSAKAQAKQTSVKSKVDTDTPKPLSAQQFSKGDTAYAYFGPRPDRTDYHPGFTSMFEGKQHTENTPAVSNFAGISDRIGHIGTPYFHIKPFDVAEGVQNVMDERARRRSSSSEQDRSRIAIEGKKDAPVPRGDNRLGPGQERGQIGPAPTTGKDVVLRPSPNWSRGGRAQGARSDQPQIGQHGSGWSFGDRPTMRWVGMDTPQLAAAPHGAAFSRLPERPIQMREVPNTGAGFVAGAKGLERAPATIHRPLNPGDFGVRADISRRIGEFVSGSEKARTPDRADSPLNREIPPAAPAKKTRSRKKK